LVPITVLATVPVTVPVTVAVTALVAVLVTILVTIFAAFLAGIANARKFRLRLLVTVFGFAALSAQSSTSQY
jgi:hypothetical protein